MIASLTACHSLQITMETKELLVIEQNDTDRPTQNISKKKIWQVAIISDSTEK